MVFNQRSLTAVSRFKGHGEASLTKREAVGVKGTGWVSAAFDERDSGKAASPVEIVIDIKSIKSSVKGSVGRFMA